MKKDNENMTKSKTNAQNATEKAIEFFGGEYQMARSLNVAQSTIHRWRCGIVKPGRRLDVLAVIEAKTKGMIRVTDFLS